MKDTKQLLKQFIIFTITIILGLILGGIIFLINHQHDINFSYLFPSNTIFPTTTITYHSSTSTIEIYLEKGEFLNAYNEALEYTKEHPNDSLAYKYLGLTLFQLNKYDESNKYFELALQDNTLNPLTKAEIYYFIGRNYIFLQDYEKALNYNQKAIELNPDYSLVYDALGMIMIKQNKYQEAIPFLEKELLLIPNVANNPLSAYPYYYLAKAYLGLNDYHKAQQMIEIAKKLVQKLPEQQKNTFVSSIDNLKSEIEKKLSQ
jgi:tetratricopeptide (TPR) repeat protein